MALEGTGGIQRSGVAEHYRKYTISKGVAFAMLVTTLVVAALAIYFGHHAWDGGVNFSGNIPNLMRSIPFNVTFLIGCTSMVIGVVAAIYSLYQYYQSKKPDLLVVESGSEKHGSSPSNSATNDQDDDQKPSGSGQISEQESPLINTGGPGPEPYEQRNNKEEFLQPDSQREKPLEGSSRENADPSKSVPDYFLIATDEAPLFQLSEQDYTTSARVLSNHLWSQTLEAHENSDRSDIDYQPRSYYKVREQEREVLELMCLERDDLVSLNRYNKVHTFKALVVNYEMLLNFNVLTNVQGPIFGWIILRVFRGGRRTEFLQKVESFKQVHKTWNDSAKILGKLDHAIKMADTLSKDPINKK